MIYRIDKDALLATLTAWDGYLKKHVRLIACGGTAMTLLNVKASTKDIDFVVPVEKEHDYLVAILQKLGYVSYTGHGWKRKDGFVFDLYRGPRVFTTRLIDSPLEEGRHTLFKEFTFLYVGILNDYDLLISKLFRGNQTDIEDCLALIRHRKEKFDLPTFERRFRETASYDVSENRVIKNLEYFMSLLTGENKRGK
jgi:hypothetical protein